MTRQCPLARGRCQSRSRAGTTAATPSLQQRNLRRLLSCPVSAKRTTRWYSATGDAATIAPPFSSLTTGTGSSGTVRLGHITGPAPHPIRTAKLSPVELAAHGTTDHGAGPSAPTEREETASFRTRPQDTCSRATSGHVTTPLFLIYSAAGHHPRDAGQRRRAVPASRGVPACSPADPSSLPGHRHGDGCKRTDSGRISDSREPDECSARRWKTGRRAVRSFDPYYSLTLMLELRGPDYSRSPTPRVV